MNSISTGDNLDDFLVNLADGLSQAQSRLNRSPVMNALGQETMVYHIPKMEFELHLHMTTSETSEGNPTGISRLRFTPATKTNSSEQTSATSIVKGVMVSTPASNGLPMPALILSAQKKALRKVQVDVAGNTSDGQPMSSVLVELNIDRELSLKLNQQEGRNQPLKPSTSLSQATVTLDNEGKASVQLTIATQEKAKQLIAITADFAAATETLLYRFE